MTSVIIPSSVTTIDYRAFRNCRSLDSVFFESVVKPSIGADVFTNMKTGARAIVPSGATTYGAVGSNWNGLIVTYTK